MSPASPASVPVEIAPHADRRHVVLSVGDYCIGLTKTQALHAAVLLLEESAALEGRLTSEELGLLTQLSRRLTALAAQTN